MDQHVSSSLRFSTRWLRFPPSERHEPPAPSSSRRQPARRPHTCTRALQPTKGVRRLNSVPHVHVRSCCEPRQHSFTSGAGAVLGRDLLPGSFSRQLVILMPANSKIAARHRAPSTSWAPNLAVPSPAALRMWVLTRYPSPSNTNSSKATPPPCREYRR